MNINFTVNLNGTFYSCQLKKQTNSWSLSCDDQNNNQVAFSTGLSEDAFKVIKLMLLADDIIVEDVE